MEFFQKILLIWQKVSLVQRALLVAVLVAAGIMAAILVRWASQPDMALLYGDLSPAEASKITERVSEEGIAYLLRDGGTAVYVPREHVYQLRLDLAKDGLPASDQAGYKLFDDEKIGISPFVQNVNLTRAHQDELAKSIQVIDGIEQVRVHIVTPEQSLFADDQKATSASVVLRIKPGYRLTSSQIAGITHLVSGAVKGLKPQDVTIVDSEGRLLSGEGDSILATGAGTVHDYRERVEQALVRKAEDMLTAVLGPGRATVRVSAVVDMNSVNTVTETYDPTTKVATKEEITTNKESGGSGQTAGTGTEKSEETSVQEYLVGKTVKQQVVLPGKVRSLSVAAFVDLSDPEAEESIEGAQPALIMEVTEVEQIIRTALGLSDTDSLTVVHARFHRPTEALMEEKPNPWPRYMALARQLSMGLMAVCGLVVFRIFGKARGKATAATQAQLTEGTAKAGGMLGGNVAPAEPIMVRRQIAHALRNNPEQVREMFLNWIEERE